MAGVSQIGREHVLAALREQEPLEVPGTVSYRLVRGEQEYDAVAVVDTALDIAGELPDGEPLTPRECALLLRGLAFEVAGEALPPLRFTSASTVGAEHAHATWALAARERLSEIATTYGDSITYHELADHVQRRSLIRTNAHPRVWIGDVLGRVARDCAHRREPLLTSLVVDDHGKVGASYATALEAVRGLTPDDVDAQAAQERLECHRRFGAELPADGGGPVVLRRVPAPRPSARRASAPRRSSGPPATRERSTSRPQPVQRRATVSTSRRTAEESVASATATRTCPVHFTVIPPSGVCDYCE